MECSEGTKKFKVVKNFSNDTTINYFSHSILHFYFKHHNDLYVFNFFIVMNSSLLMTYVIQN